MDILRKELEQIYAMQHLEEEILENREVESCKTVVGNIVTVTNACCVITDAARDYCYIYCGELASLLGMGDAPIYKEIS